MSNAPSRNPAGNDSLPGLLKFVFKKYLQKTDSCLPATVLAYDSSENRAQIQPAIVQITTGNSQVKRGQLASVPVLQMGGGGFVTYYPVKTGDTGWIIACDRDISLFKKTYKAAQPNTFRLHSFADSWFVPDSMLNGVSLIDNTKMCIQSTDGLTGITIGEGIVNIIAATSINFTSPAVNFSGTTNINGIGFNTHRHTGVTTGTGDSGGPIA